MVCSLVTIHFDSPNLAYNKNKLYKTLDYWSIYAQFWCFNKESENSFSTTFCVWISKQNVSHCLIVFTSWDIGYYKYCNCLFSLSIATVYFPDCDAINFEINHIFLIKPLLTWPKIQDKNLNVLRKERAFKVK